MEIATAAAVVIGAVIIAVTLNLCAGKIAQAVIDRPVPVPPAPIIHQAPAAPAASSHAQNVRVRWEDGEVEFSAKDVGSIISELIGDVFKDLTAQDKMLLKSIYRSHQSGSLHRLPEDFRRGSQEHQYYRRLRDSHLIRPVEGKFLPAVRIEMTEFGVAVIQRFPALLESDDTGVGVPAIAHAG